MGSSLTLDTGALISLERKRLRITRVVEAARERDWPILAPSAVIAEWWRGPNNWREQILASLKVETLDKALAKTVGEAIASIAVDVDASLTIDAIVMATAARFGSIVYTGDFDDLDRFAAYFPSVKILTV